MRLFLRSNDKLTDKKVEKTISLAVGDLMDASKVKADQRLLEDKYLEKGIGIQMWKVRFAINLPMAKRR